MGTMLKSDDKRLENNIYLKPKLKEALAKAKDEEEKEKAQKAFDNLKAEIANKKLVEKIQAIEEAINSAAGDVLLKPKLEVLKAEYEDERRRQQKAFKEVMDRIATK